MFGALTRAASALGAGAGTQGGAQLFLKFAQFVGVDVADRPEIKSRFGPVPDVEALRRRRGRRPVACLSALLDKEIDHVFASLVDDRRHCLPVEIVQSSAEQGEPLRGQVGHRRRHINLTIEPRLDRVLIARLDIGQPRALQGT